MGRETCFLNEVFFFGSSLFSFHIFFYYEWMTGCSALLALFLLESFSSYILLVCTLPLGAPYESVGGC
jgi:hypothetical protein